MIDHTKNIRVKQLETLLNERLSGSQIDFAKEVQINPGQVSHWVRGFRNLGEKSARNIENKLHLPTGWLDKLTTPQSDKGIANRVPLVSIEKINSIVFE